MEEIRNPMGVLSHETKLDDLASTDDEKNAKTPNSGLAQYIQDLHCEGDHALLQPLIFAHCQVSYQKLYISMCSKDDFMCTDIGNPNC